MIYVAEAERGQLTQRSPLSAATMISARKRSGTALASAKWTTAATS